LSRNTGETGANRQTNRDLTLACTSSGEQEGRDIGTHHQQHDTNRERQGGERRATRRDRLLLDRFDIESPHALRKWLRERTRRGLGPQRAANRVRFVRGG